MPAKPSTDPPLTEADKLERTLNRLIAAEKRKLKNENILYLEKNGDIGYESVRTVAVPNVGPSRREGPDAPEMVASHESNFLPETLMIAFFGNLIGTHDLDANDANRFPLAT